MMIRNLYLVIQICKIQFYIKTKLKLYLLEIFEDIFNIYTNTYRKYKQKYTLLFPSEETVKINFQTPQDVTNYLIKHALSIGYYSGQLYEKKVIVKENYTHYVFSCIRKTCDSVLEYRRKGDMLFLEKFRNTHSHKLKLTPKKAKTQQIRQYLMDLPAEDNIEHHIQEVKRRFQLTKQQAKYIKSKLFWRFDNDDDLLQKLTQRNVKFRRDIQNGVLLICSQTMISNYQKYGDLFCFDITYKLLKKKKRQVKHLGVGFFVGQDQNTRIIIFAMCTIATENTQNFKKLFSFFFQCMGGRVPETILTDDQRALVTALQALKIQNNYKYNHLLDWYHKIEAIKRRIRRQHHKDIVFPLFCKLLKQPSKQIYRAIIYQIAGFLKKQEIMMQFLRQQQKYCLCQVPCTFFGFGVSSTRAQSMNNLIKRYVSHQTNLGKLVFFVLRVERRLLNNMKLLCITNEQLLTNIKDKQLIQLKDYMQHMAYDQIRQYYQISMETNIKIIDILNVQVPFVKYDRSYFFKLRFDLSKNCWVCQCNAIYKTGMPCSHLVKIIRHFEGCVGYYINERWIHNKHEPEKIKISRPPIAKNRRRI